MSKIQEPTKSTTKRFTHATGAPVADNTNIMTAGRRGPALLQDIWLIEKMAHFDREVIPERRMHAKGWGAYGTFTVTHDITRYTKAKIFSKIGNLTPKLVVQNCAISAFVPGSCSAKSFAGKPSTAKPWLLKRAFSFSKPSYCGVKPHFDATFTISSTLPR